MVPDDATVAEGSATVETDENMTTTYYDNDSGGVSFTNQPAPPVGGVDRPHTDPPEVGDHAI